MSKEDRVWFDARKKLLGICSEIGESVSRSSTTLVLAHFKTTLATIEDELRRRDLGYKTFLPLDLQSICYDSSAGNGNVWLGLAAYFSNRSEQIRQKSDRVLHIIVVEHHPMASHDRGIEQTSQALACDVELTFHSALTDPIFKHFGADRIAGLMKQLGMSEDEFISHPLISTAITNAQEKIEKKVNLELQTMSPEDWIKYNLPVSE